MKLAGIFNKAMNRCYELLVLNEVCDNLFNVALVTIPSREARQKWMRKVITKTNRDDVKDEAIKVILNVIHDDDRFGGYQAVCDNIIQEIAGRVVDGQPEPDEDGFESLISRNGGSGGSSPAASPPITPSRVPLPASPLRPAPTPLSGSSDESFLG